MQGKPVPANLAEVVGPLREADEYQRFQLQRQRGVYNLLTGLPAAAFLTWWLPGYGAFLALGLLFLTTALPKMLLPVVQKRRPDWVSSFLDASLLKKALEKLFWLQAPFIAAYSFWILIGIVLAGFLEIPYLFRVGFTLLHVTAMAVLLRHSRKNRDGLMEAGYWAALAVGLLFTLSGSALLGELWLFKVYWPLVALIAAPPLVASAVRLFAPRRWLVR